MLPSNYSHPKLHPSFNLLTRLTRDIKFLTTRFHAAKAFDALTSLKCLDINFNLLQLTKADFALRHFWGDVQSEDHKVLAKSILDEWDKVTQNERLSEVLAIQNTAKGRRKVEQQVKPPPKILPAPYLSTKLIKPSKTLVSNVELDQTRKKIQKTMEIGKVELTNKTEAAAVALQRSKSMPSVKLAIESKGPYVPSISVPSLKIEVPKPKKEAVATKKQRDVGQKVAESLPSISAPTTPSKSAAFIEAAAKRRVGPKAPETIPSLKVSNILPVANVLPVAQNTNKITGKLSVTNPRLLAIAAKKLAEKQKLLKEPNSSRIAAEMPMDTTPEQLSLSESPPPALRSCLKRKRSENEALVENATDKLTKKLRAYQRPLAFCLQDPSCQEEVGKTIVLPTSPKRDPFAKVDFDVIKLPLSREESQLFFGRHWFTQMNMKRLEMMVPMLPPDLPYIKPDKKIFRKMTNRDREQTRKMFAKQLKNTDLEMTGELVRFEPLVLANELESEIFRICGNAVNWHYWKSVATRSNFLKFPQHKELKLDFIKGKVTATEMANYQWEEKPLISAEEAKMLHRMLKKAKKAKKRKAGTCDQELTNKDGAESSPSKAIKKKIQAIKKKHAKWLLKKKLKKSS